MDFVCFLLMVIQVMLFYMQCLSYNVCSAWFLDIRISTCLSFYSIHLQNSPKNFDSCEVMHENMKLFHCE